MLAVKLASFQEKLIFPTELGVKNYTFLLNVLFLITC